MVGRGGFSPFSVLRLAGPIVLVTRSCISRAALLVKVTARTLPGLTPFSIRCAIRKVMTRVLPVPAPARINTGPSVVWTAARCGGLSADKFSTTADFRDAPQTLLENYNPSENFSDLQIKKFCFRRWVT